MKRHRAIVSSTLAVLLLTAVLTGLLAAGALGATKPTVRLQATTSTVKVGHVLHLTGTVRNTKASATSVLIYEMVGTHWQRIATAKLSAKHTFAATVTPEEQGTLDLRAVYRFKMSTATAVVLSNTVAITVKPAPGDWVAVACGSGQSLALKTDGSLWAWGDNHFGQLGLGDTKNRLTPRQVGSANNWAAVACGDYHTVALKRDGTLWTWGANDSGQLGLGSADSKAHPTPTQVGSASDWVAVAGGYRGSLALKSDGSLWVWGYNEDGELGLGDTTERHSPTQVGVANDWAIIAGRSVDSMALKSDGTLWAWGVNMIGDLGLGDTSNRLSPTEVGSANDWAAVACGLNHTLALKTDGSLWAWGDNTFGQLGLSHTAISYTPAEVGSANDWAAVSCGHFYSLALKRDGTLWAWGNNMLGHLGLGSADTKAHPTPTRVGSASDWATVVCGDSSSLALKTDGSLWAWGGNSYGQLGLGDTTNRHVPTLITGRPR